MGFVSNQMLRDMTYLQAHYLHLVSSLRCATVFWDFFVINIGGTLFKKPVRVPGTNYAAQLLVGGQWARLNSGTLPLFAS